MYKEKTPKAFTLIELLVVIAIIGILSTLVIVSLGNSRAKARDSKRLNDLKAMANALELYYANNNQYPPSLTPGQPLEAGGITYMRQVPSNPTPRTDGNCPNEEYRYLSNSPQSYSVISCIGSNQGNLIAGGVSVTNNSSLQSIGTTNGLVLYLDASNPASYPGFGNTWYDLSGQANNGTLGSGFAFNPNGYFDSGTTTFPVNKFNAGSPQQGTFRMIMKMPPLNTVNQTIFFSDGGNPHWIWFYRNAEWGLNQYAWLMYYTNTGGGNTSAAIYSTYLPETWYDLVITFSPSGAYSAYVNGSLVGSPNLSNFVSWNRAGNSAPFLRASSSAGNGNMAFFQWYNRPLTAEEVAQNYNAIKNRFGL